MISHMVQMKPERFVSTFPLFVLYIPHGSDETFGCKLGCNLCPNFISHMVQMKLEGVLWRMRGQLALYPTWFRWNKAVSYICNTWPENFISHMVQMKQGNDGKCGQPPLSLYPTWFRWNRTTGADYNERRRPLYPTWFRWNFGITAFTNSSVSALYPTWFRWNQALDLSPL